ncbi:response regulator transcription factor [Polaribacter vadi]|uniref:response regulator transcription factor n=1 Tax=Polaribacter TaxID=52959 RepID=UPI001C09392A|nr:MULTISPECIES: response regulator transcription factor [Polaribacter]MBU3010857.1 response regulator transcription factor [Polaribacter vadi]MDO6740669.1 response regulator transcription factor [Polaribacter sp. 1_MG-2023]
MTNYSVVVVDDHTLLSQAIQTMVNTFEKFEVLYTCKNGQELVNQFSGSPENIPDIVLMDINMPILNGIETTEWIQKNHPIVNVMALSVEDDDKTVLKMLKAGAIGYLLKDTEKSVLEKALIEIAENGFYHSKNVTNLLMKSISGNGDEEIVLKEKEIIFLKLACTELTYKEIADRMCLSPKTIDGYRNNLFIKLNVKNRVGLVMYAIKNKIYTP